MSGIDTQNVYLCRWWGLGRRLSGLRSSGEEQVWARAEEGWTGFDSADGPQQNLTVIGEPTVEIRQQPGRTLHGHYPDVVEPGISGLGQQLVGQVEESGGEPAGDVARVAVLAVGQVALDDRLEARLAKIAAEQPVQSGGIAADRGRHEDATRAKNAASLRQRPHPVGAIREVVQRAQQQRSVHARIQPAQRARITEGDARQAGHGPCLLDVQRYRIDQVNLMTLSRQRRGVSTGSAADVENDRRRRR